MDWQLVAIGVLLIIYTIAYFWHSWKKNTYITEVIKITKTDKTIGYIVKLINGKREHYITQYPERLLDHFYKQIPADWYFGSKQKAIDRMARQESHAIMVAKIYSDEYDYNYILNLDIKESNTVWSSTDTTSIIDKRNDLIPQLIKAVDKGDKEEELKILEQLKVIYK